MLPVLLLAEGRGVMWNVRLVWQKGCRRLCANLTKAHIMSKQEENLNFKKINIIKSFKILSTGGTKRPDYISLSTNRETSRERPEFNNTLLSNVQNREC
jgi:hypothetical protein